MGGLNETEKTASRARGAQGEEMGVCGKEGEIRIDVNAYLSEQKSRRKKMIRG